MRRVFGILLLLTAVAVGAARAQTSDSEDGGDTGGLLVRFLENTLSDENRQIQVTGLDGAFSSRATIEKLTVSDAKGVWLTVTGAVLDWNRAALLRGNFSVNALTAKQIVVARKPIPSDAVDLPSPEARPFSLPELPVAVTLGEIGVERFEMGEPVMGIAAALKMAGNLTLADGALDTKLSVTRLDRPGDAMDLLAQFSNETRQIALDLKVIEDAGGLISTALNMPDRPPLLFTAKGAGPVSDFTADIALVTDDAERIGGQVRLSGLEPAEGADPAAAQGTRFSADLAGDVTPMLPADYRAFFGAETRLALDGVNRPDGRMQIDRLDLSSDALSLNGRMAVAAGGALETALLQGRIAPPSGETVLLPLSGPQTRIGAAQLTLRMDGAADAATKGDWDLTLTADRLARPDLSLRRAELTARGTLDQSAGLALQGELTAGLRGLEMTDAALARAVGSDVTLDGGFATTAEGGLAFNGFELTGSDYTATLDGRLNGLDSGFAMDGKLRLGAADLGRFSGLAGRDLGGAVTLELAGSGAPLAGTFDIALDMRAQDLSAGIDKLDPLIAGPSTLSLAAARGADGLTIRDFTLDGTALSAQAQGTLKTAGSALRFRAALDDLARIAPEVSGPLTLTGDLAQSGRDWQGEIALKGPDSSYADLSGSFDPEGRADLTFEAQFDRIERFVPELPGKATAQGTAKRNARGIWTIEADATGPAGVSTRIAGGFDETEGRADLTAKGDLRLEAANPLLTPNSIAGRAEFDLALKGPPALASLSGTLTTSGTRMAIPSAAQTIEDIAGSVTLDRSSANIALTAALGAGGGIRVSGPVALTAPYDGRIAIDLQNLQLTDNRSITSSANGRLLLSGPLTAGPLLSGRVDFGETDINLSAVAGSAAAAPIPDAIAHVNEPAAVRATRARAGLIDSGGGGTGPAIGLDLSLVAQNRVFARGFGLQAELGGALQLRGTTAALEPVGEIELIRGTLDIIGRRLKLTKGTVSMQGDLTPYVEFASSTTTEDGRATIEIAGPLDAPKVNVYAEPERPAEEALAMLVFGSRVADLSPFVIAKMAASLATLGRSGGTQDKMRKAAGVDTLDIGTDAAGAGRVGAGAYISENIYTDFNVNTEGDTEVNLNLDLTRSLTAKGSMDNTGNTGIGLFFERDY